jgi:hypothetical protein
VAGIAALTRRAPLTALGVAVLLYGFEGSVKILLGLETTPLRGGNRAAGAFLLDLGLLAAIAGVLLDDRLATPKAFWARATRAERRVVALLGAWLALSVLQMAQGGEIARGLHGFRLFQAYTAMAVVGAVVFAKPELRLRAARGLLAIGFAVSLYAAFRVIAGPARSEYFFATSVETVTAYGQAFRAVGSFSSAVGLSSFLAPLVAFALVAGYLLPGLRTLAWVTGALAIVGLIGSYGRASLFGIAFGLLCALVLMLLAADVTPRRKLAAAGLVVLVLAGAYGGVQAASHASPQLRERARGILNPFDDASMKLRFRNWRRTLAEVGHSPLGHGVGSVGGASASDRKDVVTTDNSFLKVLFEQGVLGAAIFLAGMVAAVVGIGRRLRWAAGDERGLGLAALAGFVTFLGISMTGEYVEQPGKVVAWGLLGIAAAQVLGGRLSATPEREGRA